MKKCSKCKIEKSLAEFSKNKSSKDGYNNQCKTCYKEYQQNNKEKINENIKEYQQLNKDKLKEYRKEYYKSNKDKINTQTKQYYQENKEKSKEYKKTNKDKINEYRKEYQRNRRKTDPLFKLAINLRNRTSIAFRRNGYTKNTKTQEMLGVDWEIVKQHIETQFTKGMNWDNQGQWHIDHIIPLASAKTEEELIGLCHYTNLQPLWAEDNLSKSDKIDNKQILLRI